MNPAPGWYPAPDPQRSELEARYWDGQRWTDSYRSLPSPADPASEETAEAAAAKTHLDSDSQLPEVDAESETPGSADLPSRPRRPMTWIPRTMLVGAVLALIVIIFVAESDARGPVGWVLSDETTRANPLREPPTLIVTTGGETQRVRLSERQDGLMRRVPDLQWSLDEPVTITLEPVYDADERHTALIDLRAGGANALTSGWFLRVDVIVRDRSVELVVNQPRPNGIMIERVDVYRVSLRRQNEARQRSATEAVRGREPAAATENKAPEPTVCARSEATRIRGDVDIIFGLLEASQNAFENRIADRTFTFPEYRAAVGAYIGDLRAQQQNAESVLRGLDPSIRGISELERVIQAHILFRESWEQLLIALRTERDDASATTFQDLYPAEFDAIVSADSRLVLSIGPARVAVGTAANQAAAATCERRER